MDAYITRASYFFMSVSIRSIVIAFIGVAAGVACGAGVVYAEEGSAPPPPPPSDSGGSVTPPAPPPPPKGQEFRGEHRDGQQPEGGRFEQRGEQRREEFKRPRTESSGGPQGRPASPKRERGEPFEGGEFHPPSQGQGRPFEGEEFRPEGKGEGQPFGEEGEFHPPANGGFFGERGEFDGPSDEGDDEDEFDRREREDAARRLQDMKRNLRGMEQGYRQFQRTVERLVKKGITVPAEYQSLVSDLTKAVSVIRAAKEFSDEVEAAMEVIEERGAELHDAFPRLASLEQWPKMEKQARQQIQRLEKALSRAKKGKGAEQYAEAVAKVEAEVGAIKARFEETKRLAAAGEFEEAMETFEDFFESINEAHHSIGLLEQLRNVSKMLKSAERDISRFEKEVNRLGKRGKDVGALRGFIAEGRAKLEELRALAKQGGADPEDFFELMQQMEDLRRRAFEEFDRASGRAEAEELQSAVIQSIQARRLGF